MAGMKRPIPPDPVSLPENVPEEVHDEIMRRIRNRWHENRDKCSLRRGGPGLRELVGVLPLLVGLPVPAVKRYVEELKSLRPLYKDCTVCSAKLCALIYLALISVDLKLAMPWLMRVNKAEDLIARRGVARHFVEELLETRIS